MATLRCGNRPLLMDRFLAQRTYLGVLEGKPNPSDNARMVQQFVKWVEQTTGYNAPHVLQPQIDESRGYPRLPEYACAVELTSFQPASDETADMSYAVVVWFQAESPLLGSPRILEIAENLKWVEIARDGSW